MPASYSSRADLPPGAITSRSPGDGSTVNGSAANGSAGAPSVSKPSVSKPTVSKPTVRTAGDAILPARSAAAVRLCGVVSSRP